MSDFKLDTAASAHDLIQRQSASKQQQLDRLARVADANTHTQRNLERYVQDLVCQLGDLSVPIPPHLTGVVDESTVDDLRVVLTDRIQTMREESELLTSSAVSHRETQSARSFGSIPQRIQELHALKQQSRALKERKDELQKQLTAQRSARLESRSTGSAGTGSSRYNSLTISTQTTTAKPDEELVSSASNGASFGFSSSSENASERAGSKEVLRRALQPQLSDSAFDSPRLETRVRSLFSPTVGDSEKAPGFTANDTTENTVSAWAADEKVANAFSTGGSANTQEEGSAWSDFSAPAAFNSSSDEFGDFSGPPTSATSWSTSGIHQFDGFGEGSNGGGKECPASPSLLVFSPSEASSATPSKRATSRFFGDDSSNNEATSKPSETLSSSSVSVSMRSIMDLYPAAPNAQAQEVVPVFDVFAEATSFSALDAGNEIDVNIQEAVPAFAPAMNESAMPPLDGEPTRSKASDEKAIKVAGSCVESSAASMRESHTFASAVNGSGYGVANNLVGDQPPPAFVSDDGFADFPSFDEPKSKQQDDRAWGPSEFGKFDEWSASGDMESKNDSSFGNFGAFEASFETDFSKTQDAGNAVLGKTSSADESSFGNFTAFEQVLFETPSDSATQPGSVREDFSGSDFGAFGTFEASFDATPFFGDESSATKPIDNFGDFSAIQPAKEFSQFGFFSDSRTGSASTDNMFSPDITTYDVNSATIDKVEANENHETFGVFTHSRTASLTNAFDHIGQSTTDSTNSIFDALRGDTKTATTTTDSEFVSTTTTSAVVTEENVVSEPSFGAFESFEAEGASTTATTTTDSEFVSTTTTSAVVTEENVVSEPSFGAFESFEAEGASTTATTTTDSEFVSTTTTSAVVTEENVVSEPSFGAFESFEAEGASTTATTTTDSEFVSTTTTSAVVTEENVVSEPSFGAFESFEAEGASTTATTTTDSEFVSTTTTSAVVTEENVVSEPSFGAFESFEAEGASTTATTTTDSEFVSTTTTSAVVTEENVVSEPSFGAFESFEAEGASTTATTTTDSEFVSTTTTSAVVTEENVVSEPSFGAFESFEAEGASTTATTTTDSEFVSTTTTSAVVTEENVDHDLVDAAKRDAVCFSSVGANNTVSRLDDDEFERMLDAVPSGSDVGESDFDLDAAIERSSATPGVLSSNSAANVVEEVDELLGGEITDDIPGKTYTLDEVDSEIDAIFSPTSTATSAATTDF
uniref:Uncharacterized protein n=1 Tax=Globisporangium ultimum (strain ATCC 200006 / CBS 805.95 / DAOM BR144) TaxID=431595 RepID=K3WLV9_GLOUD